MADVKLDISPMYEGERIRKEDLWIELAGPKAYGFELSLAAPMDQIQDGKVTVIGPEPSEIKEGSTIPFGMIFKTGGEKIEKDLESIIERRNHALLSYVSGLMHLNQRYDIWMRMGKSLQKKGVTKWEEIFKPIIELYKAEMPFIEKMEVTIVTDPEKVKEEKEKAMAIYKARDERAKGLHDEDVMSSMDVPCARLSPLPAHA
jgi:acetyl-CoA decarbonylase/synthase complex subunit beta